MVDYNKKDIEIIYYKSKEIEIINNSEESYKDHFLLLFRNIFEFLEFLKSNSELYKELKEMIR